jgi:hypothetical protein
MKVHRSIFHPFQCLYPLPFNSKLRLELTPRHETSRNTKQDRTFKLNTRETDYGAHN